MKWTNDRSKNVEDRRGQGGRKGMMIGGGLGTIVIALIVMFLGGDPTAVLNNSQTSVPQQTEQRQLTEGELKMKNFIEMLSAELEETWREVFEERGWNYREPKVVMFEDITHSGCGTAQVAMGPFYCPADETIYMDMRFFNELSNKYGAKTGEFTIAYVMAHEVGHHIQNLLGVLEKVEKAKRNGRFSQKEVNQISVAVELQADFYAGLWAKRSNDREDFLEAGDIDIAISAAEAVGDDNIQRRSQGYVNQESFTHGSSAQRREWFMRGYNSGNIEDGNTFQELLK
ncbi:MAG: neutral zinc metallopeptidase [Flavobacteriaceae bacterium]|nr:neutral zinc metallopeptidase [Flavobacteriaceae bacterium]